MKKNVLLAVAAVFTAFNVQAAELSPEQQIAADMIVRQVVAKNLLGNEEYAKSQTKMLQDMVNRTVKAPYTSVQVTYFECDHALNGKDQCSVHILDATTDGTESLNSLDVQIQKGEVKSAQMNLIAG
ncbi:hypothetical protein D3C87_1374050 [compost metagenome]